MEAFAYQVSGSFADSLGPISLAIGMTAGALFQCLTILIILSKNDFHLSCAGKSLSLMELKNISFLASVMLFGNSILAAFLPDYFASGLNNGAFTSILNGRKILDLATSLLIFPLVLILYPRMVKWANQNSPGLKIQVVVRGVIWLSIPVLCLICLLGPYLVEFLFEHGNYTTDNKVISQMTLIILTPEYFTALFSIITRWILAQNSPKTLVSFCVCLMLGLLLSIPVFELLTNQYQEIGLLTAYLILQIFGFGESVFAFYPKLELLKYLSL